jgi:RNA polymerase sigma-70 factor, ECF subfamily
MDHTSLPEDTREVDDRLQQALMQCAAGERQGLRTIFELESARLLGVAMRILKRRDLAEEIVQEAFVTIWRKSGQYSPGKGSARGWIYTIVRNRALNRLRDDRWEVVTDDEWLATLRQDDHSHNEAWEQLNEADQLRRCLEALDEPKRQSILLAYVSGYSHGEIAGRLKAPLGTTKAWIRRGLLMLRECLS